MKNENNNQQRKFVLKGIEIQFRAVRIIAWCRQKVKISLMIKSIQLHQTSMLLLSWVGIILIQGKTASNQINFEKSISTSFLNQFHVYC